MDLRASERQVRAAVASLSGDEAVSRGRVEGVVGKASLAGGGEPVYCAAGEAPRGWQVRPRVLIGAAKRGELASGAAAGLLRCVPCSVSSSILLLPAWIHLFSIF